MLQRATYDKDAKFDLAGAIYDAAVGGALGAIGGIGERKALPLPGGTEAQGVTQSEFDRIRLKTAEEEAAEAEKAEQKANRQAQRMTPKDYEQQRRDLDELWETWGKQATMTREAPEKTDTADLVTSEVKKEEKTFKESVKDLGATLRRKWIDSADAVKLFA